MSLSSQVLNMVGGRQASERDVEGDYELIQLIRAGLPIAAVNALLEQHYLTLAELDRVVMPRKTLYHRRKLGSLTPEQSDRLLRVVRILALAEDTFGNREKAATWLRRPTRALANECPLDLLDTGEGARQVEILLGRIAHGIAA